MIEVEPDVKVYQWMNARKYLNSAGKDALIELLEKQERGD